MLAINDEAGNGALRNARIRATAAGRRGRYVSGSLAGASWGGRRGRWLPRGLPPLAAVYRERLLSGVASGPLGPMPALVSAGRMVPAPSPGRAASRGRGSPMAAVIGWRRGWSWGLAPVRTSRRGLAMRMLLVARHGRCRRRLGARARRAAWNTAVSQAPSKATTTRAMTSVTAGDMYEPGSDMRFPSPASGCAALLVPPSGTGHRHHAGLFAPRWPCCPWRVARVTGRAGRKDGIPERTCISS